MEERVRIFPLKRLLNQVFLEDIRHGHLAKFCLKEVMSHGT